MRRAPGYILLEALVAMGLLSVSLLVIHRDLQQAVQVRALARDFTQARFLLEQVMADVALQAQLPESERTGTFPAPLTRFSWRWKVSKLALPAPQVAPQQLANYPGLALPCSYMMKVEAWVSWERNGVTRQEKAETLYPPEKLFVPIGNPA